MIKHQEELRSPDEYDVWRDSVVTEDQEVLVSGLVGSRPCVGQLHGHGCSGWCRRASHSA